MRPLFSVSEAIGGTGGTRVACVWLAGFGLHVASRLSTSLLSGEQLRAFRAKLASLLAVRIGGN